MDTQDSPVVPSRGGLIAASGCRISFDGPDIAADGQTRDFDRR